MMMANRPGIFAFVYSKDVVEQGKGKGKTSWPAVTGSTTSFAARVSI